MLARIVSLVLIAAVVACPLTCGNGLCHAGQCCSEMQASDQVCPAHGTAQCCCGRASSDEDHCPSGDRGPCRCPGKSSCQGVCGGAVFEKQIELDGASDSSFLSLVDTDTLLVTRVIERRTAHGAEHHWHRRGGNHGRSLRALHMSFLC